MAISLPKRPRSSKPNFRLTHKTKIIVQRFGKGELVRGRWVDGIMEEIELEGNVQPLKGIELLSLPESDRTSDTIKIYTVEKINTVDDGAQHSADIVIWNGKKYKAIKSITYQMGVLDHTKTICARLPETPNNKAV